MPVGLQFSGFIILESELYYNVYKPLTLAYYKPLLKMNCLPSPSYIWIKKLIGL